jgi:hypothetical protein
MVFNATFNNISVISWRSFLLEEETGVAGDNHQPVASLWQTLSHNVVASTLRLSGVRTHNKVALNTISLTLLPHVYRSNTSSILLMIMSDNMCQYNHRTINIFTRFNKYISNSIYVANKQLLVLWTTNTSCALNSSLSSFMTYHKVYN